MSQKVVCFPWSYTASVSRTSFSLSVSVLPAVYRKPLRRIIFPSVFSCNTAHLTRLRNYRNLVTGNNIRKEVLALPKDCEGKLAFALYDVFTEKECQYFIDESEYRGYEDACFTVKGIFVYRPDMRNNSRLLWDTVKDAGRIWKRIESFIPDVWANRSVVGLNERLRFLRYGPGEYFKPHLDYPYTRDNGEKSFVTVQVYLNDNFEGGYTNFVSSDKTERCEIVPKTGTILVFQHDILHEGSVLTKGRKYTVRTDVMYAPDDAKQEELIGV